MVNESKTKKTLIARGVAQRLGAIAGSSVVALSLWTGLSGSMRAAPLAPDPVTCLPTCAIDGRSFVVAGDDNTTLGAQEISLGLHFTAAAGPDGNFELFDGDRVAANWDVPFNDGTPAADPDAPQLILELFADPAGIGGSGPPIFTWTPGAVPAGTELGDFPVTNNAWSGVTFTHDPAALNVSTYQYALHVRPANPAVDKGWNAFKVRAAGTVQLLGNQVVGFLGAMNVGDGTLGNPGDLTTIYPAYPSLTPTVYDGTWSFKTFLPPFLGDVTVFDGDMDFGNSACDYKDTDDPDSSGIPPFALGSAAVAEGVATTGLTCTGGGGERTGLPADDNTAAVFRRVPTIVPAGIAYQLVAPDGQIFLNQNPTGNKEWEQFKIQKVNSAADIPGGIKCPAGGFAESPGFTLPDDPNDNLYPASDCRTTVMPGGVWEVQLDGMDLSNLNFWFFSFKVEPIVTEYSIGRLVWYDANENGVQDLCAGVPCAPELGIANVAYTVYDGPLPGGNVVRTGFTDANGEFLESGLPAGNYTVEVDASNFAVGQPLNGLTSTTGGEVQNGIEVGLPVCTDTNTPPGCGQPIYDEALFGYVAPGGDGVLAFTSETCRNYTTGVIDTEYTMQYSLNGNTIAQDVEPGHLFFFTTVTVGPGQTLSISQSHTGFAPIIGVSGAKVYTTDCNPVSTTFSFNSTTGTVTYGALPPGTYIVEVKLAGKSLPGKPAPNPSTSQYTFVAQLNGVPQDGTQNDTPLTLMKKQ